MAVSVQESDMTVLSRHLSDRQFGGVDVYAIIRDLGIQYSETPMAPDQSGQIQFENDEFHITVNSNQSRARRKFTAAHELAHFLLHRDLLLQHGHMDRLFDGTAYNPSGPLSKEQEIEANKLAAQILMPKERILREVVYCDYDLSKLAEAFGVSSPAMEIRLKVLGIDLHNLRQKHQELNRAADEYEIDF